MKPKLSIAHFHYYLGLLTMLAIVTFVLSPRSQVYANTPSSSEAIRQGQDVLAARPLQQTSFTVVASAPTVPEGNIGNTPITFTVSQMGVLTSVSYTLLIASEATAGLDFENLVISGTAASGSGTINFSGPTTKALVTLDVIGDFIDEDDELIRLIIGTYDSATTTILDDDTSNVTFLNTSANTGEGGNNAVLPIVLTSQPTDTVTVNLISSDTTEGTVTPASLVFTTTNWNAAQNITIMGQDDTLKDGNITYTIRVNSITSNDVRYAALNTSVITPVAMTNIDNELTSNLPPTVTLVTTAITTPEDVASAVINFTVTDDATPAASLVVTATSSNPTLLPNGNITLGGSGSNRTIRFTPAMSQSGVAAVNISVTDANGLSTNKFILLTVTPNNQPPVSVNDTETTQEDVAIKIAVLANDSDADGTLKTNSVTITSFPTNGNVTVNGDGSITYTPKPNFNGSDSFTYRVSDNDGLQSAPARVFVGVTAVNDGPVVDKPIPDQMAEADSLFQFTVAADSFSDVDGNLLLYTARQANGLALPSWLSFVGGSRTFSGTPVMTDVGTLIIEVIASDGIATKSDTFNLVVKPNTNRPPQLVNAITDKTVQTGTLVNEDISANFTDPDGDNLTFTAKRPDGQPLPSWLSLNPTTGRFTGNVPTNAPIEAFVVTVTATDPDGKSASDNFVLTVQTAQATPTPTVTATPTLTTTPTPTITSTATPVATVTLDPNGRGNLTGTVRDRNGGPLPGITVLAFRLENGAWKPQANIPTNANGQYSFSNLPTGQYRLQYFDVAGKYANLYYANTINFDQADIVTVLQNQTKSNVDVSLPSPQTPQVAISGSVSVNQTADGRFQLSGSSGTVMTVDFNVSCDSGAAPTNINLLAADKAFAMSVLFVNNVRQYRVTVDVRTEFAVGSYPLKIEWQCDGVTKENDVGQLTVTNSPTATPTPTSTPSVSTYLPLVVR